MSETATTETEKPLVVIGLKAERFRNLTAVDLTLPLGGIRVTGRNEQGKTNVLDVIETCITGKIKPGSVQRGEEDSLVELRLGVLDGVPVLCDEHPSVEHAYTVRRRIRDDKTTSILIKQADGSTVPGAPQKFLDSLFEPVSFDPIAFDAMEPKRKAEILRRLVGLDLTALKADHKRAYEARTQKGSDMRAAKAAADHALELRDQRAEVLRSQGGTANAATARIDTAQATREMTDWQGRLEAHAQAERGLTALKEDEETLEVRVAEIKQALAAAEGELENIRGLIAAHVSPEAPSPADRDAIEQRIRLATVTNSYMDAVEEARRQDGECKAKTTAWEAAEAEVTGIEQQMADAIASAQYPVEGLSVSDDGVLWHGNPAERESFARRMSIWCAIAAKIKPRLRLLLIREASMLDTEHRIGVVEAARANGIAQVLMEMVGDGGEGIYIEAGEVVSIDGQPVAKAAAVDHGIRDQVTEHVARKVAEKAARNPLAGL